MWIVPVLIGVLIGAWIVQQIWVAQEYRLKHRRHQDLPGAGARVPVHGAGRSGSGDTFQSLFLDSNPIVFVTRTGSRYHLSACHYLSRSQIPIRLFEAVLRGYTPCAHCRQILAREQEAAASAATLQALPA